MSEVDAQAECCCECCDGEEGEAVAFDESFHVSPYPLMIALRIAIDQRPMRPKQKLAMKSQFGLINI